MNWPQFISWEAIVAGGGIVAGMVVFVQNLMTIRNLRMENQILREQLSENSRRIHRPTPEEVERYSRSQRNLAGLGLALLVAVGLVGVRLVLNTANLQRHAALPETLEERLAAGDPSAINASFALAQFYVEEEKYDLAESLYEGALAAERRRGSLAGEVFALNGLATVSRAQHEYAQAEALYSRSLDLQKTLGPEHPAMAETLNGLAEVYKAQHEYAEAEAFYTRSLDIQERTLGPEHPAIAETLEGLAVVYRETGREKEAAALEKRARRLRGLP